MNYKMMGKFLSQILIVEAGFMVPALLISLYTGSRAAVYGFGPVSYTHLRAHET